jgi:hypothetical protein
LESFVRYFSVTEEAGTEVVRIPERYVGRGKFSEFKFLNSMKYIQAASNQQGYLILTS